MRPTEYMTTLRAGVGTNEADGCVIRLVEWVLVTGSGRSLVQWQVELTNRAERHTYVYPFRTYVEAHDFYTFNH